MIEKDVFGLAMLIANSLIVDKNKALQIALSQTKIWYYYSLVLEKKYSIMNSSPWTKKCGTIDIPTMIKIWYFSLIVGHRLECRRG